MKGLVCLRNRNNYLLNQVNASEQVHSEINESPINSLFLVLFLLEDEHVMVEELLQLLIGKVDAQLLEAVVLMDVEIYREKDMLFNYLHIVSL